MDNIKDSSTLHNVCIVRRGRKCVFSGARIREVRGRTLVGAWGPGFVTKGRRFVREGGPRPSARVGGNYGQAEGWLWGFLSVLG